MVFYSHLYGPSVVLSVFLQLRKQHNDPNAAVYAPWLFLISLCIYKNVYCSDICKPMQHILESIILVNLLVSESWVFRRWVVKYRCFSGLFCIIHSPVSYETHVFVNHIKMIRIKPYCRLQINLYIEMYFHVYLLFRVFLFLSFQSLFYEDWVFVRCNEWVWMEWQSRGR